MSGMDDQALYYELGYGFRSSGKLVFNPLMNRIMFILIVCSIILQVGFGVNQIITLLLLILLLLSGNQESINLISRSVLPYYAFGLVLVSGVEQWLSDVKVPRGGNLFEGLSLQIFLLDLIWVGALFYLLFLLHISNKSEGDFPFAIPLTEKAVENYQAFEERLKLSQYDLSMDHLSKERSLLIGFYLRIVFLVIFSGLLLSLGTVLIWRIYLTLSDQVTVAEQYDLALFSLLSLLALIFAFLSTISFSNET